MFKYREHPAIPLAVASVFTKTTSDTPLLFAQLNFNPLLQHRQAKLVGWMSAATSAGFVCGPALSIVTVLGGKSADGSGGDADDGSTADDSSFDGKFIINKYTGSAWLAILLGIVTLAAVVYAGEEQVRHVHSRLHTQSQACMSECNTCVFSHTRVGQL